MKRISTSLAALLALALAGPTQANDTIAELHAGGLVFVPSEVITMVSEDLFISTKEVRVRYLFRNTSDTDVRSLVAFPMPDLQWTESDVGIPEPEKENFLDFHTLANGKPVETSIEMRVTAMGLDQTRLLTDLKVPLSPRWQRTTDALDALPQDAKTKLLSLGLVRPDEFDAGKGLEHHLAPLEWTLKTTYYWMQTFPAKADLVIEHRYRPSVGAALGTLVGLKTQDADLVAQAKRMEGTYCIDSAFKAAVAKAPREKGSDFPALTEERVSYVLKTGANWFGPIGDFTLTVDKGAPENLVSFCGTNVKKIGPTTFQMKAKDFFPTSNLDILILKPAPPAR